jgi:hypothetical protein
MLAMETRGPSTARASGRLSRALVRMFMRHATVAACDDWRSLPADHARRVGARGRHMDARTEDTDRDGLGVRRANLHADRVGRRCRPHPHSRLGARRRTGKRVDWWPQTRRRMRHFRAAPLTRHEWHTRYACHLRRRNLDRIRVRAPAPGSGAGNRVPLRG